MSYSNNYKKYSPNTKVIKSSMYWDSDYVLTKDEEGAICLFVGSVAECNFVDKFENEVEVQKYFEELEREIEENA